MPRNGAILHLSPELQRNALCELLRTTAEGHWIFMDLFGENGAWHAYKSWTHEWWVVPILQKDKKHVNSLKK